MEQQPTMLITGASGRIGTTYRRHLAETTAAYQLRLTDVKRPQNEVTDDMWHIGNLSDPDFARQVVAGVDTILHLGADPNPDADFYASLIDNNFKATYNVFQAAADAGVRKVIYASSVQAVSGYTLESGRQIHADMAVRPLNMYGASKCFGEATAAAFAYTGKLSAICVRIGWFVTPETLRTLQNPDMNEVSGVVTDRDLCHLFDCCVRATNLTYAIVPGLSNNRFPLMDLSEARALLGYDPQDDALVLAGLLPPRV